MIEENAAGIARDDIPCPEYARLRQIVDRAETYLRVIGRPDLEEAAVRFRRNGRADIALRMESASFLIAEALEALAGAWPMEPAPA